MNNFEYKKFYRRNLPHFQPKEAYIFVTYRLAFSLPVYAIAELKKRKSEFDLRIKIIPKSSQRKEKLQYFRELFLFQDDVLNKYTESPMWLKIPEIAGLTLDSLRYSDGKKYDLICAMIMPNHIHILIKPLQDNNGNVYSLAGIMAAHKKFVALQANKILNRAGSFWQRESFDHIIRDEDSFHRCIRYILNNPVKANLVKNLDEWKYYYLKERE